MSEQSGIIKMPEAAGVVGHRVERAWDKVVAGVVAVRPLEKGVEAKEVGTCRGCGRSALGGPSNRSAIVAVQPDRTLVNVAVVGKHRLVRNRSCKFQVRNRQRPCAELRCDQGGADGSGKWGAPDDRGCIGVVGIKPDASHARSAGVASADVGGGKWDEFPKVCGATVEGVGKVAKIRRAIVDVTVEPDAVLIPSTQGVLEYREEASGARNCEGHGAELAQQLVPLRDGCLTREVLLFYYFS